MLWFSSAAGVIGATAFAPAVTSMAGAFHFSRNVYPLWRDVVQQATLDIWEVSGSSGCWWLYVSCLQTGHVPHNTLRPLFDAVLQIIAWVLAIAST